MIFQKPIPLTKESVGEILRGDVEYGVSLKRDGILVFITCKNGFLVVKDENNQFIFKFPCNFDFSFTFVGEFCEEEVVYVFDFLSFGFNFKNRIDIINQLNWPQNFIVNDIRFPRIEDTFKILFSFDTNQKNDGFIFTPCNVMVKKSDFTKFPIFKWKPLELLTADLLIRFKKVYCGVSLDQFNALHKDNVMFFKTEYFGMVFGNGKDSELFCERTDCENGNLCFRCVDLEEKVVECKYSPSGWIPIKIRHDKTLQFKNSKVFKGPNNFKTVNDIVQESKNFLSIDQLANF
jgi:hypothetical protein